MQYIVLAYDYNIVTTLKQKQEKEDKQSGKRAQICIYTFLFGSKQCAINNDKDIIFIVNVRLFECLFPNQFYTT